MISRPMKSISEAGSRPLLDVVADEVAQRAAEILVARVRKERPRVGQHAHEAAQQTQRREGVHLFLHAVLLVEEPPPRSELDLPGAVAAVLEIADHRGHQLVVARIEVVDDGLRKAVVAVEHVEEFRHLPADREVADRVEARIGTQPAEHAAVVVADGAVVELLGPAGLMVHRGELDQHGGLELADLLGRQRLPAVYLIKNSVDLGLRIILGVELLDAVVRKAAADRPEELVTHARASITSANFVIATPETSESFSI